MPDGGEGGRVCDVPIEHLYFMFPLCEPHLARALGTDAGHRFAVSDLPPLLLQGKAKLWVSWDRAARDVEAAMITEIIEYPRLKECRVWLIGGRNMKAWHREFMEKIEAFARNHGCIQMSGGLRKGWARVGGYRVCGVELIKPL